MHSTHNNCNHCGKPIVLVPSAQERADKDSSGRPAKYYKDLFTMHSECVIEYRKQMHPVTKGN